MLVVLAYGIRISIALVTVVAVVRDFAADGIFTLIRLVSSVARTARCTAVIRVVAVIRCKGYLKSSNCNQKEHQGELHLLSFVERRVFDLQLLLVR